MPWYRHYQPTLQEQLNMTDANYKELFGEGELYENQPPFSDRDLFKDPLWHPGKINSQAHLCFMHAENLFAGGPLFRFASQFALFYQQRTKTAVNFALADMILNGVSFLNLQWIMYNPQKDEWHSPELDYVIERLVIHDFIAKDYTLESFFDDFALTEYIIQWVDLPESMDPDDILSNIDSHVCVMRKVDGKWYLLDVTEDKPICLEE
jgi:hypothetical protein